MIMSCDCKSEFQDDKYGPGKRLWNRGNDSTDGAVFCCTGCGKRKTVQKIIQIDFGKHPVQIKEIGLAE